MCNIHIHILSTHSVLLDILTVINTHYTPYVHILHYVHIYTYTVICKGAVDCTAPAPICNGPENKTPHFGAAIYGEFVTGLGQTKPAIQQGNQFAKICTRR